MKTVLLATVLLGFAASSAMAAPALDVGKLLTFTVQDITAADADATAPVTDATGTHMKDAIAHQCYAGVLTYMSEANGAGTGLPPAPIGAISAFQDARDILKGVQTVGADGPLPEPIIEACGALYLDAKNDALKAAAQAGSVLTVFGLKLW